MCTHIIYRYIYICMNLVSFLTVPLSPGMISYGRGIQYVMFWKNYIILLPDEIIPSAKKYC